MMEAREMRKTEKIVGKMELGHIKNQDIRRQCNVQEMGEMDN
jgi:hypothetical protein